MKARMKAKLRLDQRRRRDITEPSALALGENQIAGEPRSGGTVFHALKWNMTNYS